VAEQVDSSTSPTTTAFRASLHFLFSVFFPDNCRLCQEPLEEFTRAPVCRACLAGLRPLRARAGVCPGCGLPLDSAAGGQCRQCAQGEYDFKQARSFGSYDGALRELLHLFKYARMRPLAAPLAARMAEVLEREWGAGQFDALVAVPLARDRQRERGYNQAQLLALELERRCRLPVLDGALSRVRATAPQTGLTRAQRLENLRGAFAAGPRAAGLDARRILLIDDVMTTGATLSVCARVLSRAGAASVCALTVARTLLA
jgi:ComF family protein